MSSAPNPSGSDPHDEAEQLRADLNDRLAASSSTASSSPGHSAHSVSGHADAASHSTSPSEPTSPPSSTVSTSSSASISRSSEKGKPWIGPVVVVIAILLAILVIALWPQKPVPDVTASDGTPKAKQTEKSVRGETKSSSPAAKESNESKKAEASPASKSAPELAKQPVAEPPEMAEKPEPKSLEDFYREEEGTKAGQPQKTPLLASASDVEKTIMDKLDKYEHIESKYSPLLLYRLGGKKPEILASGVGYGSRTLTVEDKLAHVSEQGPLVGWYSLRGNFAKRKTGGILKVHMSGAQIASETGQFPNVVCLTVGGPRPINLPSTRTSVKVSDYTFEKEESGCVLHHIFSGEGVRVVGHAVGKIDKATYSVIEYSVDPGEEGMGFVKKDGDVLHLLIGQLPTEDAESVQKELGTTKKLALVYGPVYFE